MRRIMVILALFAVVLFCVQSLTQQDVGATRGVPGTGTGTGKKGSKENKGPFYVLVERTDLDVNCTVATTVDDINARIQALTDQNKATKKANSDIQAEINKLSGQLAAKKAELAKAKDDKTKGDIQKEIDALKEQILQKKLDIKPLVKWDDVQQFQTKKECDDFVAQVTADANNAKVKAMEAAMKKATE